MSSDTVRAFLLAAVLAIPGARGEAQEPRPEDAGSRTGRVAAQVLVGGVGSFAASLGLAVIGSGLEGDCNCDDPGLMGAIFGGLVGAALGPAIPVYLIGNAGPKKGSFGATVLGGVLGMGTFLLLRPQLQLDPDYTPFWVAFWGFPTAGAVAGYHLSAKPKRLGRVTVPLDRLQLSVVPSWQGRGRPGVVATVSF